MTMYFCRRNQNYTNILRFLNLGDKKINPFDITHRFTHLFWLGDLNYRVDFPSTVSLKGCSMTHSLVSVLSVLELSEQCMKEHAYCQWAESHFYALSFHRKLSMLWQRSNSSSIRTSSIKTSSAWRGMMERFSCILVSQENSHQFQQSVILFINFVLFVAWSIRLNI